MFETEAMTALMKDTHSKVALVTGSAAGIGRETAILLAERGYDVAVNYSKSESEAADTVAEVTRRGRRAILCKCNVADDAGVRAMVRRSADELGGLDVLANNAGMTHGEFCQRVYVHVRTNEKSPRRPSVRARTHEKSARRPSVRARTHEKSPRRPSVRARTHEKSPRRPSVHAQFDT